MPYEEVCENPCFPAEEEKILKFWREENAFKNSYEKSKGKKLYTFYDGPPFATGMPHYGHILAGTIKDIVTRYAHQTGHCVERRFGWDCHGLPVEYEIDKLLNFSTKSDVLKYGIHNYNEKCRSIVMRYSNEWRSTIERLGRWIDFDNDYKTLDVNFMESVWWTFSSLYKKKLIYRSFKVMPYSIACNTPISNFEANLNYKDTKDPSIVLAIPLREDAEKYELLIWTTTPWTLPSNLAVCVHPDFIYYKIINKTNNRKWIVAETRFEWLCHELKLDVSKDISIVDKVCGASLAGLKYVPIFPFFFKGELKESAFRVITDDFVTSATGTGLVHCAPAFGEDDFRVCKIQNIIKNDGSNLVCPVDDNGNFNDEVEDFSRLPIKEADKKIIQYLKRENKILLHSEISHSYPFCWRSETPLIYKAVPSWFMNVESIKDDLLKTNEETYWVPAAVKEKRFYNWLRDARDWCISRNRYWGTPIPLWVNADFSQIVCIESVSELEKYAGRKIEDIHRHHIDDIKIPDPRGPQYPPLSRIEEVFDCWFESGSMPYGQLHYPFENKDKFNNGFPADFIAEGIDQTRGWFYTLMVISTALFNKPAFKNNIVNGLVLASDGKKMSKRLKNYPDPVEVVNKYGADALRLYLVNSPVVKAESISFKEEGVKEIIKDVILPWYHAYRFLMQQIARYESQGNVFRPSKKVIEKSDNLLDKWIMSCSNTLIEFFHQEMKAYHLYTVAPRLIMFLDQLTNWYVRLNRDRMRGTSGLAETEISLCTLFEVLMNINRLMASFTPFISDLIYRNMRNARENVDEENKKDYIYLEEECIHFVMIPDVSPSFINHNIENQVQQMQTVVNICRSMRFKKKVSVKTPLKQLNILHPDKSFVEVLNPLLNYIREEVNVIDISLLQCAASDVKYAAIPNFKQLGVKLGSKMKEAQIKIKELSSEDLQRFEKEGEIEICGFKLNTEDLILTKTYSANTDPNFLVETDNNLVVMLDFTTDESLQKKAFIREMTNRIQKMKKSLNLCPTDMVEMWYYTTDEKTKNLLNEENDYLIKCLRRPIFSVDKMHSNDAFVGKQEFDINGVSMEITFSKTVLYFNESFAESFGESAWTEIKKKMQNDDFEKIKNSQETVWKISVEGKEYTLERKLHFGVGYVEAVWLTK